MHQFILIVFNSNYRMTAFPILYFWRTVYPIIAELIIFRKCSIAWTETLPENLIGNLRCAIFFSLAPIFL